MRSGLCQYLRAQLRLPRLSGVLRALGLCRIFGGGYDRRPRPRRGPALGATGEVPGGQGITLAALIRAVMAGGIEARKNSQPLSWVKVGLDA